MPPLPEEAAEDGRELFEATESIAAADSQLGALFIEGVMRLFSMR